MRQPCSRQFQTHVKDVGLISLPVWNEEMSQIPVWFVAGQRRFQQLCSCLFWGPCMFAYWYCWNKLGMEPERSRVLMWWFSPTFPQVGINIIEAQKLVGVNINPFVVVKVGEEKRHTVTQKSTNCPFYNEVCVMEKGFIIIVSQVAKAIHTWGALGAAALRKRHLWGSVGSPWLSCLSLLF